MRTYRIASIPGDGIGNEVIPGAVSKDELATRIANMRECGATMCDTVAEEG